MVSPVAGLRPMRALRCAFTARPMPGITNLPALRLSSTARLKRSSKNDAACFFEIGLSFVLTLSAICAMILDLLIGFAIESFSPQSEVFSGCSPPGGRGHYSRSARLTQAKMHENAQKIEVFPILPNSPSSDSHKPFIRLQFLRLQIRPAPQNARGSVAASPRAALRLRKGPAGDD